MQVNIPIFMQIISKLQPHGRTLHRVPSVLLKLSLGWQERDPAQKTHKIPIPNRSFWMKKTEGNQQTQVHMEYRH